MKRQGEPYTPRDGLPVRVRDEGSAQDRAAEARDLEGHLAVVLPRRQDRRDRQQRRGQEHAPADHGRDRQGLWRRGDAGARAQDRVPRAGAPPRSEQGRPRQRRGRGRRDPRAPDPVRGGLDEAGRGHLARRDGQAPRPSRASCRTRSRRPTPGSSTTPSRSRWTRCAARRATPTSPSSRAASAAASRCAGCCCRSPTCCCSTSRPTTSTPRACAGSRSTSSEFPGTVVAITHDRYFLDNVAKWILELDRGEGFPFEGNYSAWLEHKAKRLHDEDKQASARERALAARARVGAEQPQGAPGQEQGPHAALRRDGRGGPARGPRSGARRSSSRPGRGSATRSWSSTRCARASATAS